MGFRVSAEDETTGVDFTLHAETAYDHGVLDHAVRLRTHRPAPAQPDPRPTT